MNAVEVEHLDKRFDRLLALADVSTSIPAGSMSLLVGPNGAGKSTLLRIVAGLSRPTRGKVRVLGADLFSSAAAPLRGKIGFLGAQTALYDELTVEENLRFSAKLHAIPSSRIDEAVSELNLEQVVQQRVRTLSLGFRRRAALARTLLAAPEIVLLDEPWNGLDTRAAEQLARLLARLRDRGRTILVAAHAVAEYEALFDRTLRLVRGRLLAPEAAEVERQADP